MKESVKLTFTRKKLLSKSPGLLRLTLTWSSNIFSYGFFLKLLQSQDNHPRVTWKLFVIHFVFFIIQFMFLEQIFWAQVIHFGDVCHFWVLSDNNAAKSIKIYYFLNLKFRLRHDSHLLLLFFMRVT